MESANPPKQVPGSIATDENRLFGRGGKSRVMVLDREETSVPVRLSEFGLLSIATAKAAFWWSVTCLLVGSSLSLYLSGLAIPHPNALQTSLTRHDPIVVAIFAGFSVIAAIFETLQRRSLFHRVQRECGIEVLTLGQRMALWRESRRRNSSVQAEDRSLLLSPMQRVPPEDASALRRDETAR
jgi:hypothetical protein